MKKIVSLHVNIPHPCNEKWEKMQALEDGRFCEHCSKKVIDISFMSDAEVVYTLEKYRNDLCGHYREDQLNRELVTEREKNHSLGPAIILSTMLTAGAAITSSSDVKGASLEMVQSDTTMTPPCSTKDTTENLLAGYSALGRDLEIKGYALTRQTFRTGMTAVIYNSLPVTPVETKVRRKWYQFWKKRR